MPGDLCRHYIKHTTLDPGTPYHIYSSCHNTIQPPLSPCSCHVGLGGVGGNNPITLEEAQSWSNGRNIKRVLRQVTYLMDPGGEGRGRGEIEGLGGRLVVGGSDGVKTRGAWGEVRGGVNVTARVWHERERPWRYPSALEQTVIETTLINFCTLSPSPAAWPRTQWRCLQEASLQQKRACHQLWNQSKTGCVGGEFQIEFLSARNCQRWARWGLSKRAETVTSGTQHFAKWVFLYRWGV